MLQSEQNCKLNTEGFYSAVQLICLVEGAFWKLYLGVKQTWVQTLLLTRWVIWRTLLNLSCNLLSSLKLK